MAKEGEEKEKRREREDNVETEMEEWRTVGAKRSIIGRKTEKEKEKGRRKTNERRKNVEKKQG